MTTSTQHSTALAVTWCRMWNDDPSLAHLLVGGHLDAWFGNTGAGDRTTDAESLEAFVAAYRARTPNVFTPRTVVADPVTNRMAYTWDVDLAEGVTVSGIEGDTLSGVDVNVLDGCDRIAVNWTVPMHVLETHELPAPPTRPLPRATLASGTTRLLADRGARPVGELVIDEAQQRTASTFVTDVDGAEVGGLAVVAFGEGGDARVWQAVGTLPQLVA